MNDEKTREENPTVEELIAILEKNKVIHKKVMAEEKLLLLQNPDPAALEATKFTDADFDFEHPKTQRDAIRENPNLDVIKKTAIIRKVTSFFVAKAAEQKKAEDAAEAQARQVLEESAQELGEQPEAAPPPSHAIQPGQ